METHGPLVTNIALGFTMLSPVIALIIEWFLGQVVA